jgi:hypothetical protein
MDPSGDGSGCVGGGFDVRHRSHRDDMAVIVAVMPLVDCGVVLIVTGAIR